MSWWPSLAWMMASTSVEVPSASEISDSHVVNLPGALDRQEASGSLGIRVDPGAERTGISSPSSRSPADEGAGAGPTDARNPLTFIKGSTYLGRSVDDIKRKERSLTEGEARRHQTKGEVPADTTLLRNWAGPATGSDVFIKRGESLVWIKKNTFYKEVLDDWKEQNKEYDVKIKVCQKSQGEVTNEIYNLLGFFSVFQGVILTAVAQLAGGGSKLLCGKVWFPIVLSVLAAIIAIVGIALKFQQLHKDAEEIIKQRGLQWQLTKRVNDLKWKGENFYFGEANDERGRRNRRTRRLDSRAWIFKYILVGVSVSLLTAVFILSYFVILCDKWVIKSWQ